MAEHLLQFIDDVQEDDNVDVEEEANEDVADDDDVEEEDSEDDDDDIEEIPIEEEIFDGRILARENLYNIISFNIVKLNQMFHLRIKNIKINQSTTDPKIAFVNVSKN